MPPDFNPSPAHAALTDYSNPGDATGMRGRAVLVLLALLCMSWAPVNPGLKEAPSRAEAPADGTYDVLLMGNSYTSANTLRSRLQSVFDDAQQPAMISDLTGGGMKLYEHADNAENTGHQWHTTLTTNDFDFVVLQDQSQVPSFPPESSSNQWQDSKDGAIRLDSMIADAGAETVFFQTWGYRDGDSNNMWRNPDYPTMQANLESGYRLYAENVTTDDRTAYIAPVGLAFQVIYDEIVAAGGTPTNSSTLFYGLYSSDGSHPSSSGSYVAACVIHATITGTSSVGLPDDVGLDANTRLKLQQAADAAVFNNTPDYAYPWQITGGGAEGSDLVFGSNDGSNFILPPGGGSGIAVNLTNYASFSDVTDITIISDSGWEITWNHGDGYALPLNSGEMDWIQFGISVPEVAMGLPLAGSKHTFSVVAVSQFDGNVSSWTFTIQVLPWHGAEITVEPINATVDPDLKVRVPVTVRNLGNAERSLSVRIRPVTETGEPIANQSPSILFIEGGWGVGIFELYNVLELGPYDSGTVQLEFDSPNLPSGTMWVEFSTWSTGAPQDVAMALLEVNIVRERSATMELNSDCDVIAPGTSCDAVLTMQNTGNYRETLQLQANVVGIGAVAATDFASFTLQPGQSTQRVITFTVAAELMAEQSFNPYVVLVSDDGFDMASQSTVIEVGPRIAWEIHSETVNNAQHDNITITYTLRNTGNTMDGLDITVSTNVWTGFGLIPPVSSDWDEESAASNHFVVHDISADSLVTFQAWIILPHGQDIQGVAEVTVEMRSILDPDIRFTNTTEYDFAADVWHLDEPDEPGTWELMERGMQSFWNAWGQILLSTIVVMAGSLLLFRAVQHRQEKDAAWAARHAVHETLPAKVEDWMGRFENGGESEPEAIESPAIPAHAFQALFQMQSQTKPAKQGPSSEVVGAAQTVLEHHDSKADYAAIDDLVDDLLDEKEESDKDLDLDL